MIEGICPLCNTLLDLNFGEMECVTCRYSYRPYNEYRASFKSSNGIFRIINTGNPRYTYLCSGSFEYCFTVFKKLPNLKAFL